MKIIKLSSENIKKIKAIEITPQGDVVRIMDGSLLESESLSVITELAKDNDYQVWIEQVDESGQVGFYLEEGELISIDGESVTE